MLPCVLLYVVDSTLSVNLSMNAGSLWYGRLGNVDNAAVLAIRDLKNGYLIAINYEHSCVVDLSAAGWIKRSPVQHHSVPALVFCAFNDARVKGEEVGVVIVETFGRHLVFIPREPRDPYPL